MNKWQWFQLISFQLIWLSAVLGRNQWIFIPIGILALHFMLTPNRASDIKVMVLAASGFALDLLLLKAGVFKFDEPPYWLAVLWGAFVLNFAYSLMFLRKVRWYLLCLIGGISGSYAYIISSKLGAVELPLGTLTSGLLLALVWAVIVPLLARCDEWLRESQ
jgi:hypothetical protein